MASPKHRRHCRHSPSQPRVGVPHIHSKLEADSIPPPSELVARLGTAPRLEHSMPKMALRRKMLPDMQMSVTWQPNQMEAALYFPRKEAAHDAHA